MPKRAGKQEGEVHGRSIRYNGLVQRSLLVTVVLLAFAGCSPQRVPSLLIQHTCRCNLDALQAIASVRVQLEGTQSRKMPCIEISQRPGRLDDLQDYLRGQAVLDDLKSGTYRLTMMGYEASGCQNGVVACGYSSFALPPVRGAIEIPVRCQTSSDGHAAAISETACLEQAIPPYQCSGAIDGGIGDGGGSSTLDAVTLASDGTCTSSKVDAIDSVQISLYVGSVLHASRCHGTPDSPSSLTEIYKALPTPLLDQVSHGNYLLLVLGFDSAGCPDKSGSPEVIACGGASITVPTTGTPTIEMGCVDDTDPISVEACRQKFP